MLESDATELFRHQQSGEGVGGQSIHTRGRTTEGLSIASPKSYNSDIKFHVPVIDESGNVLNSESGYKSTNLSDNSPVIDALDQIVSEMYESVFFGTQLLREQELVKKVESNENIISENIYATINEEPETLKYWIQNVPNAVIPRSPRNNHELSKLQERFMEEEVTGYQFLEKVDSYLTELDESPRSLNLLSRKRILTKLRDQWIETGVSVM